MKTFDLLITFNKRLLSLILLSLIHAGQSQKLFQITDLQRILSDIAGSLSSFAIYFFFLRTEPCLSETSEHETAVAVSFQGMSQRFEFVNFKEHKFFFLNLTTLAKRVVKDSLSCAFSLFFGQPDVFLFQRCCFSRQIWKIYL